MDCSLLSFPVLHFLPEFAQTHVPLSQWCHSTISSSVTPSPPALSFSQHQSLFQWVSSLRHVVKVLAIQHQSFKWIFRVYFFFRIDWFDFVAVQSTLKSLLHHHNSNTSILGCSAFFMVQLSYPYMTIGKTIALTIQSFVDKVISLPFNMLSRFVV